MSEIGKIDGFLCATTITTVYYIARKTVGKQQTGQQVSDLLPVFQIASVTPSVPKSATVIRTFTTGVIIAPQQRFDNAVADAG